MSSTVYSPGVGNAPFGLVNTNPESSQYGLESQLSPTESLLLAKAIKHAIFDAAPAQYNALKLLYSKPFQDRNSDEFQYLEKTFGRSPLESTAIVAVQAPAPGANQTQVIPVTAASVSNISIDMIIIYPDNTKAVVTAVGPGNQITVNSHTNNGLSAVASGDIFAIQSTIESDGMDSFSNYERLEVVERYNYVQFFARAQRWARVELQKHLNNGTTDYLNNDKQHKLRQLRVDLFNSFFNGERGELLMADSKSAKSMGGIFPTMVNSGSASANPTTAGLKTAFETLAFTTNHKSEGGTRFIYGTDEILYEFSKIYKHPGLRYAPNDEIAKLNLKKIELGTQNFVLVPCELFKEESCFPAEWQRKVLVLDQDTIQPVKMKGIPQMEMGSTLTLGKNGSRENFQDFWVKAQFSIEFNNPPASFYLDIQ